MQKLVLLNVIVQLQKSSITQSHIQNSLLYINNPSLKTFYEMYSSQFFSDQGVPIRRLKQKQIANYTDQTIFRKNTKRVDCSVVLFRSQQQNQKIHNHNQILHKVNSIKRLGAFFVQFSDFVYVDCNQQKQQNPNKSMQNEKKQKKKEETLVPQNVETTRQKKMTQNKKYCIKSKYTLCIFTYFPFINVMEQLITSMMDQIKIRRVQTYAMQNNSEKVSIKKFIQELSLISSDIMNQISTIQMKMNEQVSLSLGHFKILFNFFQPKIDDLLYGGWVFDIVKLFHRDMIYDIFVNIMTEQSICFVCQNLKLLTEVVFFFLSVLLNPFQYPHPCVSRCLQYELLDSPFIITLGLKQSSKWLEENAELYPKKIFVDLNDNQVKIVGKRKLKQIKSQKLKKIFHNFYKKLEGSSPVPQFFKKKTQAIIRPAAREQNQLVYILLKSLKNYFTTQLMDHLPNPQIISTLKQASPQLNQHSKISSILKQIQKYVRQSRKQNQKDFFIDSLTQQQIFYGYISNLYKLQ